MPLDVTRQIVLTMDIVDKLPSESTRAGYLLRRIVPFAFRAYHQTLGQESIHLHDCVALIAALQPELFETQDMVGDVETRGELTTGATIFDRRPNAPGRANMEVATKVDASNQSRSPCRECVPATRLLRPASRPAGCLLLPRACG